jgi:hypothetical protein
MGESQPTGKNTVSGNEITYKPGAAVKMAMWEQWRPDRQLSRHLQSPSGLSRPYCNNSLNKKLNDSFDE